MRRVDALLKDGEFRRRLQMIEEAEQNRLFCRHGLPHLLDVARIAWIIVLEEGLDVEKETVYLAALLHDLGRSQSNADHDKAGSALAKEILTRLGAPPAQTNLIAQAIGAHRAKLPQANPTLASVLARADKLSRPCFACPARSACKWPTEAKNQSIYY